MTENWNAGYSAQGYVPQYAPRTQYRRAANSPYFAGENEGDTYQSSGGCKVGSGLLYTAGGAGAGAAAGYWLLSNPISEGENGFKVNEKFYRALDNAFLEGDISAAIKEAELTKLQAVNINSHEEYNALKKLANAESLEKLPEEVKNALPKDITTPEAARDLVQKADTELAKINKAEIAQKVKQLNQATMMTYEEVSKSLKNYEKLETEVAKLADDIKPNELKEFITKNKELFGIKGEEAAVTAEIEALTKSGKEGILQKLAQGKTEFTSCLESVDKTILSHVDSETKAISKEAPELLKNAVKNFKWSQAKTFGLWGAATAFGAYLISSVFSSNKKQS